MRRALWIALPLLGSALPACQVAAPGVIEQGQVSLGGTDSAEYLDRIASQPNVTEADAVGGMLLLLNRPDKMTFEQAVALLCHARSSPTNGTSAPTATSPGARPPT